MEKKYCIKDLDEQLYWCGSFHGWAKEGWIVELYDTLLECEQYIEHNLNGRYQIEIVYVNWID